MQGLLKTVSRPCLWATIFAPVSAQTCIHGSGIGFGSGSWSTPSVAARVLNIAEDAVNDEQRDLGKTLNFSIIFGMTAVGLAGELGIPVQQAESPLAAHAAAYPGVAAWIAATHQHAAIFGEVRTLYGRRRSLPNNYSALPGDVAEARRQAVNTIVQGTAADMLKLTLVRLNEMLPAEIKLLLPVHDSVLMEVP